MQEKYSNIDELPKAKQTLHINPREPRPYQTEAINAMRQHYFTEGNERGILMMACGTGKTYTALKIAEEIYLRRQPDESAVRIVVCCPSISLVDQTMKAWIEAAKVPLAVIPVCSDSDVGRSRKAEDRDDISAASVYRATTNTEQLIQRYNETPKQGLIVIITTYQSLGKVHELQAKAKLNIDMLICDEAHHTAGLKAVDSFYTLVHKNEFINAKCRMYMTATPKTQVGYRQRGMLDHTQKAAKKTKANTRSGNKDLEVWDMYADDCKQYFGEEFFRYTFSQAISQEYLSDYEVIFVCVDKDKLSGDDYEKMTADIAEDSEEEAGTTGTDTLKARAAQAATLHKIASGIFDSGDEPRPLRSIVAFNNTIKRSKAMAKLLKRVNDISENYKVETAHVDGTNSAGYRAELLNALRDAQSRSGSSYIVSNAQVFGEGVDVPSLDAVVFLEVKHSFVDVVQAVGRVMRKCEGKKKGYIFVPVFVSEEAKNSGVVFDKSQFKAVGDIIKAIRATDDSLYLGRRFHVIADLKTISVGNIYDDVSKTLPVYNEKLEQVGNVDYQTKEFTFTRRQTADGRQQEETAAELQSLDCGRRSWKIKFETKNAAEKNDEKLRCIRIKIVDIRGQTLGYIKEEDWLSVSFYEAVKDKIVEFEQNENLWRSWLDALYKMYEKIRTHIINRLEEHKHSSIEMYNDFIEHVKLCRYLFDDTIEQDVSPAQEDINNLISIMAQSIMFMPIYRTAFPNYKQPEMERTLNLVYELCISKTGDTDEWKEVQDEFENNIKASLHLLPESRDRRQLINHIYEKFFVGISNTAGLELQSVNVQKENGVVYTPLEVADFMVRSADKLLRDELNTDGIGGQRVTVFDPFTGSGTFLGRMLSYVTLIDGLKRLARLSAGGMWAADDIIMPVYMAEAHVTSMLAELSDNQLVQNKFDYIVFGNTFSVDVRKASVESPSQGFWHADIEHKRKLEDQRFDIIIMNPPYVKSQRSEQQVDQRVRETYAAENLTQLRHNDFIRALRWSTDFLQSKDLDGEHGFLIAVICPDTWTKAQSGIQACLAKEFDKIWHVETRSSNRFARNKTDGECIFGTVCTNPIGIFFLLRLPKTHKDYTGAEPAQLFYFQMPDTPAGMSGKDNPVWKRQILDNQHADYDARDCTTLCQPINMNAPDAWYAKVEGTAWNDLPLLFQQKGRNDNTVSIFKENTTGATSSADKLWYAESKEQLLEKLHAEGIRDVDESKCCLVRKTTLGSAWCYWDFAAWKKHKGSGGGQVMLLSIFPNADSENVVLGFDLHSKTIPFSALALNERFASSAVYMGVPRWIYSADGSRQSNITAEGLARFRQVTQAKRHSRASGNLDEKLHSLDSRFHGNDVNVVTEDTIFTYCFAVMSHPDYIAAHEMYLRQNPPRIPLLDGSQQTANGSNAVDEFLKWSRAGEDLIKIHTQWRTYCEPYEGLLFKWRVASDEWREIEQENSPLATHYSSLVPINSNRKTDLNREDVQQAGLLYNGKVRIMGFPSGAWDWKMGAGNSIKAFCNKELVSGASAADFIGRSGGDVIDALKRLVTASIRIGEIYRELKYVDVPGCE
ncbi:MAG: DEAD/DEAH box helicase family protein [Planctomycetaceae bacterium]|nr:DEAD/DEAH box helicase family protein [Planctomycetaceae bacterium]